MSARVIKAAYAGRLAAWVNGWGSRELLEEATGRPPIWGARHRAWQCIPEAADAALILAELRGWRCEVVEEAHLLALAGSELAAERGVLW